MNASRYDAVAEQNTSAIIIDIMRELTQGAEYDDAMMSALETLNKVVHADRIYLLEHQTRLDSRFFEYCAEGIPPRIADLARFSDVALAEFVNSFRGTGIIYADTLDKMGLDYLVKGYFIKRGVFSLLVVPLRENGRFLGCDSISDFAAYTKMNYRNVMHPDDADRVHDDAEEQLAREGSDGVFSVDYRIVTKDGTVKDVAVNGHLVNLGDSGKVFYILFVDKAGHAFA